MPDMRLVFQNLLSKWGSDIYLQRKDYSQVGVGPYKTETNQGYSPVSERWTVRMRLSGRGTKLSTARSEQEEGVATNVDIIFYFPWDAAPKEEDRIYIPDPRYDAGSNTQYSGHELFLVSYSLAQRGLGGRVEFWAVGGIRKDPN